MKMRNERSFWSSEWKASSISLSHHACSCIEEKHTLANDYCRGRTGRVWIRIGRASPEQDDLSLSKTWNDSPSKRRRENKMDLFLIGHFPFSFLIFYSFLSLKIIPDACPPSGLRHKYFLPRRVQSFSHHCTFPVRCLHYFLKP
jgi:hypothetical protein